MTVQTLVLGLGNILLRDEAVGVRVVESLGRRFAFPPDVTVLDGGTLGLDLLPRLDGIERLLVVDAVKLGRAPGELVRLEGHEVPAALDVKISPHQVGLQDLLAAVRLLGREPPHVVLWGVEPARLDPGTGFSTTISEALPRLEAAVLDELDRWGVARTLIDGAAPAGPVDRDGTEGPAPGDRAPLDECEPAVMTTVVAYRVSVRGLVQGVGFRPFVYKRATRLGLGGTVRNTTAGVDIELEGAPSAVNEFLEDLVSELPPLARIDHVEIEKIEAQERRTFEIDGSRNDEGFQPISPDVATCTECQQEILDPDDRRFGYPFTNCTQCGPRFTIIRAMPYDRPNTTMADFAMCAACRREYEDPEDRRFHAEPNACAACGPKLMLVAADGQPLPGDPLAETGRLLAAGRIVAIKGIGGFHLACDATDEAAVQRLRQRKGREAKPLAVMVRDLAAARQVCVTSEEESALLNSAARPVVILAARPGFRIPPSVAPGLGHLGIMLPYSPLHHLLWRRGDGHCPEMLVLTSGNRSEEPITTDNDGALASLGTIADAFLLHDRPIQARCDDSVSRVAAGAELPIRRSRGYAPLPVRLPFETRPILACGGQLKSAVCVARGPYAFLSPHIGDLENHETYLSYAEMVQRMGELFRVRPEAVAHDLHPDYLSTQYARSLAPDLPRVPVQHHHAHVAACMAEHRLTGRVLGVAFDGSGYGTDGAVWGGEFLVTEYAGFVRAAHVGYVPMPGGDRAVREPFRMALSHLLQAFGEWDPRWPAVREASEAERRMIRWQIEQDVNAPLTSSVGRLFDAVASLLGVRHRARYEAQSAMELEALADGAVGAPYSIAITDGTPLVIEPGPVIRGVIDDVAAGTPAPLVAARFHATLVQAVVRVCECVRSSAGLERVVLSGGVFQNATLLAGVRRGLAEAGFEVFSHHLVPPNDGGLALGQAAVAHAWLQGA